MLLIVKLINNGDLLVFFFTTAYDVKKNVQWHIRNIRREVWTANFFSKIVCIIFFISVFLIN